MSDPDRDEANRLYEALQALLRDHRFSEVGFALTMATVGFLAEVAENEGEARGDAAVEVFCAQVRKLYGARPRSPGGMQ